MMKHSRMRGYTLLEMIVSVGIFSIVMLIVTGAYLSLLGLDRELRATSSLVTNLSFAVDSMARSIRTGTYYGCGSTGANPSSAGTNGTCDTFSYLDTSLNEKVTYIRKSDGTIGRCTGGGICNSSNAISLTDPNVQIASSGGLTFYVRGVGTSGGNASVQPQVTFTIRGTMVGISNRTTDFSIQTSATQRLIEI
ncbi:type II secretion system GspH family protein [Patescibacteria group bacterium]|nr:type II secretion system GspH family protein [Patescibacteria group bacterium]